MKSVGVAPPLDKVVLKKMLVGTVNNVRTWLHLVYFYENKMSDATPQKENAPIEGPTSTRRKRNPLLLRILLDTNQLYTGSASHLLCAELQKLIEVCRSHTDIQIEWMIPEIVRWERE